MPSESCHTTVLDPEDAAVESSIDLGQDQDQDRTRKAKTKTEVRKIKSSKTETTTKDNKTVLRPRIGPRINNTADFTLQKLIW